MKMMLSVIFVVTLFVYGQAGAILSPSPDQLGYYFDTDANCVCFDGMAPYTQVPVYLIYTNPTPETVWGIQVGFSVEGPVMISDIDLPGDSLIPTDPNRWQGHWPVPVPTSEATVMASFNAMYLGTANEAVVFYMGSFDEPRGGLPQILMADGTLVQMEMIFPTGDSMAGINGGCAGLHPVATETRSFSAMKALYR